MSDYVMEQRMIDHEEKLDKQYKQEMKEYDESLQIMEEIMDEILKENCIHSTLFGPLEITVRLKQWWTGNKDTNIVKCRCPCKKHHVPICANHMQYKKGCNKKNCKYLHPDNMIGTATNWYDLYKLNEELCTQVSLFDIDTSSMKIAP